MNKTILKKFLIILGLILLLTNFIICCISEGDILGALFAMAFETVFEFGELESILSILGIVFLCSGILMKNENTSNKVENKNSIVKYKILRIVGCLPFVGILCYACFCAINGFSFLFSTSYGFEAFFESILMISIFCLWPLYIIGIVLIIKSNSKIKSFKEVEINN